MLPEPSLSTGTGLYGSREFLAFYLVAAVVGGLAFLRGPRRPPQVTSEESIGPQPRQLEVPNFRRARVVAIRNALCEKFGLRLLSVLCQDHFVQDCDEHDSE